MHTLNMHKLGSHLSHMVVASFVPFCCASLIMRKMQRAFTDFDNKLLALYGQHYLYFHELKL